MVITHGEPHVGERAAGRGGSRPRRLGHRRARPRASAISGWLAADKSDDLAAYTTATGHELDRRAVAFFRLTWDLKDVAENLSVLRSLHTENDDTLDAYEGVTACMPSREAWLG